LHWQERETMELTYISARGERLPLVSNDLFDLTNIDGQTAAEASIASSTTGGTDGETVNSVQANPRPIVLDLTIKSGVDVESAKRTVLKVVKLKQRGSLEWKQNNRTVIISGIVERVEMPRWEKSVMMQVSLHCDQPFWEDAENVIQEISEAIDLHYFTDSANNMLFFPEDGIAFGEYNTLRTQDYYNDGDVAVGMEISIVAFETVTNPIIYDGSGNFLGVGHGSGARQLVMREGDNLVITTHRGNKTVKLNGESVIAKIKPRSTWLQMAAGGNKFTIDSDDDSLTNMAFSLIFKQRYV
jgi:hypothetical protein